MIQLKSEIGKDSSGKPIETWKVESDLLNKAISALSNKQGSAKRVVIPVTLTADKSATVELPADALAAAGTGSPTAIITVTFDGASYDLPVNVLDLKAIAKSLGSDLKDTKVSITLKQVTGQSAEALAKNAKDASLNLLGQAIEFSVTVSGNGKSQEIANYGSTYVTRTITLNQSVNGITPSVVVYDAASGKFSFVPATFSVVAGKTFVTIKRNGNSVYAVVESKKTFSDIQKHWARADIELLASKALLKGISEDTFAPNQLITRAEFATLLAQALGLREDKSAAKFSDITGTESYAGYVGAAAKAKIVSGKNDGSFRPDENITREQMAVMIANAIRFVGKNSGNKADADKVLAKFKDQAQISKWAKLSVLEVVEAGIMNGAKADRFSPSEFVTRAEEAAIVKRLLVHLRFIN
ncbi:S-layer homology domain-containing protein [Cohnella cholangitidis]|uniref:S-layer homology domain-containing protein n=1 Tax=Cohnella cholangitidis TaxID=2598458 RepID=UPI0015FD835D|nr:S-layer homology domain-containing protein [Cohnella cholangitidis]